MKIRITIRKIKKIRKIKIRIRKISITIRKIRR
jgi:hypothetical protein